MEFSNTACINNSNNDKYGNYNNDEFFKGF